MSESRAIKMSSKARKPNQEKVRFPTSIYEITPAIMADWLEEQGEKPFRAKQFFQQVYEQRQPVEEMTTWSQGLIAKFLREFDYSLEEQKYQKSKDQTHKWLFKLRDGKFIETVLMIYKDRATVCISSQAGCAMGCTFCATGQAGFDRHLTSAEIVEQVARAQHKTEIRISNVVFMGMGEPLANADEVRNACESLCRDFGFSARHIVVSTVGFVPGMKAMRNWDLPVTLAVSLHAPFDEMRTKLVPINSRYPIAAVLKAASEVSHVHGRRITFEYAAIDSSNTTFDCAHEFGRLLRDFNGAGGAHVNLIPLNQTTNFDGKAATADEINRFADIVRSYGPTVTVRRNRGTDIDAACGQLREREELAN